MNVAVHEAGEVGCGGVDAQQRYVLGVARHVVVHKVGEPRCVYAVARRAGKVHVEDVEHEQAHEELLEIGRRLVERPHQRGGDYRVGCSAAHYRQTQLLDVHLRVDRGVHQQGVDEDEAEADGEKFPHLPLQHLKPQQVDGYADIEAWKRP